MILLDTNVVSELMRPIPNTRVEKWLAGMPSSLLFISSVTEAELRYGLALLPQGQRRLALSSALNEMLYEDFSGRILPFDSGAAVSFAMIGAERRQAGRPISHADAQAAAIAHAQRSVLATRNVSDFEGCRITIINPWDVPDLQP